MCVRKYLESFYYFRSILNLKYGYILRDNTMIQVNFFGLALNILYCLFYFQYTHEKMKIWGQMGVAGAFSAGLIAYTAAEDPALVENRFGMIITALMFLLIASPLFGLVSAFLRVFRCIFFCCVRFRHSWGCRRPHFYIFSPNAIVF